MREICAQQGLIKVLPIHKLDRRHHQPLLSSLSLVVVEDLGEAHAERVQLVLVRDCAGHSRNASSLYVHIMRDKTVVHEKAGIIIPRLDVRSLALSHSQRSFSRGRRACASPEPGESTHEPL